jgi:hypothetical protein
LKNERNLRTAQFLHLAVGKVHKFPGLVKIAPVAREQVGKR